MGISRIDFGGTTLIDLTNDSVTPETLDKGITAHNSAGDQIVGTKEPTIIPVEKDVNFWDYDGTLLHSYTLDEVQSLTELPPAPTPKKDFLMFQEWNWTLDELKTTNEGVDVGATYTTIDGKCHFVVEIVSLAAATVRLNFYGGANIDWGDGTNESTVGSGAYVVHNITHTYSSVGLYHITFDHKTTYKTIGDPEKSIPVIGDNSTNNQHLVEAYLNQDFSGGLWNGFRNSYNLKYVTIALPSSERSFSSNCFYRNYQLRSIVIPRGFIQLGNYMFSECRLLSVICLPRKTKPYNSYESLDGCQNLKRIFVTEESDTFPKINYSAVLKCTVKENITKIPTGCFNNCKGMKLIRFLPNVPPAVANVNAFGNMATTCIVEVPAASLETYKTATNYGTIAAQMVGV